VGREAGTAPTAETGGLELVDDGFGLDRPGDVDAAPAAALEVLVERSDRGRGQDSVDGSHAGESSSTGDALSACVGGGPAV